MRFGAYDTTKNEIMYRTRVTEKIDWDNGSREDIIHSLFCGGYVPKKKQLYRQVEKSTFIPNAILDNIRHISPSAFKVYLYLIRHDWPDAKNYQGCFLKMKTLAKECGLSKATVCRAIHELRTFNWVECRPAGVKQMRNGDLHEVGCFEYTFFFPVDDGGREMVWPTPEVAKAYKKLKNSSDKRTLEDKGFGSTHKRKIQADLDG